MLLTGIFIIVQIKLVMKLCIKQRLFSQSIRVSWHEQEIQIVYNLYYSKGGTINGSIKSVLPAIFTGPTHEPNAASPTSPTGTDDKWP